MNQITKTKGLRTFVIATILILGLAVIGSTNSNCVEADSCQDVFATFTNANWSYSAAFGSYYYASPTSCQQDCAGRPPNEQAQCVVDCQINRQTALAAADTALFSAAWATCTPATVDQCDQARTMADTCTAQYNYWDYPDPDESLAIYSQYSSCRLASKIDTCQ